VLNVEPKFHTYLHGRQHERHADHVNRAFCDLDDDGTVTFESFVDAGESIESRGKGVRWDRVDAHEV
jgi:hypothetical protein